MRTYYIKRKKLNKKDSLKNFRVDRLNEEDYRHIEKALDDGAIWMSTINGFPIYERVNGFKYDGDDWWLTDHDKEVAMIKSYDNGVLGDTWLFVDEIDEDEVSEEYSYDEEYDYFN